jgi:hypothetical protein
MADSLVITARSAKDYVTPTSGFVTLADRVPCKKGQTVDLTLDIAGKWIVRAHPARSGRVGALFSSIVVGKNPSSRERFNADTRSSLIAVNSSTGMSIDFITSDTRADRVLIRRFDVRSRTSQLVTTTPIAVSSAIGVIDSGVEDLAIVRYEADLYRSNGDVLQRCALSDPVTRIEPRDIVSAQVTATPVTQGNQTIQLTVASEIKQNDVNFLISYIKSLGIETSFQTDLESLRKSLLNCVKFDITRYYLQTGEAK